MGKITRAMLLASLILVSSAIFLSQADRIAGKASTASITGNIVLFDQNPTTTSYVQSKDFSQYLYLPADTCTGFVNFCFGDGTQANSKCRTTDLTNLGGGKYLVNVAETIISHQHWGPSTSISTTYDSGGTGKGIAYITLSTGCPSPCGCTGGGTIKDSDSGVTYVSTSTPGCGPGQSASTILYDQPLPLKLTISAASGSTVYGATQASDVDVKVVTGAPNPVSHVDVSYKCEV